MFSTPRQILPGQSRRFWVTPTLQCQLCQVNAFTPTTVAALPVHLFPLNPKSNRFRKTDGLLVAQRKHAATP